MPRSYRTRRRFGRVRRKRPITRRKTVTRRRRFGRRRLPLAKKTKIVRRRVNGVTWLGDEVFVKHTITNWTELTTDIAPGHHLNLGSLWLNDMNDIENSWGTCESAVKIPREYRDYQVMALKVTVEYFDRAQALAPDTSPREIYLYASQVAPATDGWVEGIATMPETKWAKTQLVKKWLLGEGHNKLSAIFYPQKIIGGGHKIKGDLDYSGRCNLTSPYHTVVAEQIYWTFGIYNVNGGFLPASTTLGTAKFTLKPYVRYWNKRTEPVA